MIKAIGTTTSRLPEIEIKSPIKVMISKQNQERYKKGDTPTYYVGKYKGIKAIDVIYDFELEHNEASALEYILRAGKKDDRLQDLQKAVNHLNMKIEFLKENDV